MGEAAREAVGDLDRRCGMGAFSGASYYQRLNYLLESEQFDVFVVGLEFTRTALNLVFPYRLGRPDAALVQGRSHAWLVGKGAGKSGSVRKFNLHIGSVAGVLVDSERLDGLARKLGAFDVILLH